MGETVPALRGRAGAAWINLSRDVVAAVQEMWAGTLRVCPERSCWVAELSEHEAD
jgi:hypothetical protein